MKNKNTIPKFKYHLSNPCSEKYRGIEVNGEIIHWIENTDKFVELFGYTQDMRKTGVLPEEFIWNEYINKRDFDFTACIQVQIIEYLRVHSQKFLQKYGKTMRGMVSGSYKNARLKRRRMCGLQNQAILFKLKMRCVNRHHPPRR